MRYSFDIEQQNKNARLQTRTDRTGKVRTETVRRDEGSFGVAVSTDTSANSTRLFLNFDGTFGNSIALNGHEARTLYRALQRHYGELNKSW